MLAEIAGQLGRFLIFTGESERAAPYLERALTLAELLDLPETFVQALNSKSVMAMQHDRLRESRILLEGALEIALAHELHSAALRAYNNLSVLFWSVDDWKANITNIERALELARRVGHRNWEANFVAGSIGTLDLLGRWDEALARAAEADELATNEFARGLRLQVGAHPRGARRARPRARDLDQGREHLAVGERRFLPAATRWSSRTSSARKETSTARWQRADRALGLEPRPRRAREVRPLRGARGCRCARRSRAAARPARAARRPAARPADAVDSRASGRASAPTCRKPTPRPSFGPPSACSTELELPFFLALTRLEAAARLLAADREIGRRAAARGSRPDVRAPAGSPWLDRVERLSPRATVRSTAELEPASRPDRRTRLPGSGNAAILCSCRLALRARSPFSSRTSKDRRRCSASSGRWPTRPSWSATARSCGDAWESHQGVEIDTQGDSFFVAFSRAADAASAARAAQSAPARAPTSGCGWASTPASRC